MEIEICPGAETGFGLVADPGLPTDFSKRAFLRAAGLLAAGLLLPQVRAEETAHTVAGSGRKVILVVVGGMRRDESFSPDGQCEHSSPLGRPAAAVAIFSSCAQRGVTAHFNAISSMLTGNWQHVDDWGKQAPTTPTLFEQFRKGLGADQSNTWVVASNKALTSLIGASSDSNFGPAYGANVVFPKQLMLTAVVGRTAQRTHRQHGGPEQGGNRIGERHGWEQL
jgi:hypothetical protein